ncbi:LLM class flavin-dependent oxidoreductase [Nostoc sp.]
MNFMANGITLSHQPSIFSKTCKSCFLTGSKESIDFEGEIYQVKLDTTDPVKPYQQNGGPLLYFGGISEGSKEVCAKYCDVYLMWPEPEESIYATMQDMSFRAAKYGRQIDFGFRVLLCVQPKKKRTPGHRVLCQNLIQLASTLKNVHKTTNLWVFYGRMRSGQNPHRIT